MEFKIKFVDTFLSLIFPVLKEADIWRIGFHNCKRRFQGKKEIP
jgi:hypothetical protein